MDAVSDGLLRRALGELHPGFSLLAARARGLEDEAATSMAWHHHPDAAPPDQRRGAAIIRAADIAACTALSPTTTSWSHAGQALAAAGLDIDATRVLKMATVVVERRVQKKAGA